MLLKLEAKTENKGWKVGIGRGKLRDNKYTKRSSFALLINVVSNSHSKIHLINLLQSNWLNHIYIYTANT